MANKQKKSTLLQQAHQQLGWPSPEQVLNPSGAGPRVFAALAEEKLGLAIRRRPDVKGINVGVLTLDPNSNATQAPIAIVCEFYNRVSSETIRETHALAWNFCRAPLLITIEPQQIRAWTCCEPPTVPDLLNYDGSEINAEIVDARIDFSDELSLPQQAARSLHWIQLVSGQFFRDREHRFTREHRADQMLLANLKYIRQRLYKLNLSYEVIHDLLARIIFIQFLFQRKDSAGVPALNPTVLKRLHKEGRLSAVYDDLGGILRNYNDTYALFRWLNDKFNGDLFPGEGATDEEREVEWQAEMSQVEPRHLDLLAAFVSGRVEMERGQWCLWERYSFDAIPLEFISSIYEVFVGKDGNGVYYTPGHVVDFLLDSVLPWESKEWDITILDPACGSGIFLVKAFQRLVQRWRNANPGQDPKARVLIKLLKENLFGVDIDPHAVRVASFSLYLALCDEIDPRMYWQLVKFPRLRERQVVNADFFYEEKPLFRLHETITTYDLIVGNAPWGSKSMTKAATLWAANNRWKTAYSDIGPLFLPRAASMCKSNGSIVMIQPAGSLLYNHVQTARKLRQRLFREYKVEEIVNLSALRFGLFQKAVSPSCIITMRPGTPDGEQISYVCPKATQTNEDDYRVTIDPSDCHLIFPEEAATETSIWSTLMWGGRRDLSFIRELNRYSNLAKLKTQGLVKTREGIIRGNRGQKQNSLVGRPILEEDQFPEFASLRLDTRKLPLNTDPYTDSSASNDFSAFDLPQLLIKQSWRTVHGRFEAALVKSTPELGGTLCSQSYISIHCPDELLSKLEAACLSYNSLVGVYYLLLTSGRLASYRPEPLVDELLNVPLPDAQAGLLKGVKTLADVDTRIREAFHFKDSEWVLLEDLIRYTLPDFKGGISSP